MNGRVGSKSKMHGLDEWDGLSENTVGRFRVSHFYLGSTVLDRSLPFLFHGDSPVVDSILISSRVLRGLCPHMLGFQPKAHSKRY